MKTLHLACLILFVVIFCTCEERFTNVCKTCKAVVSTAITVRKNGASNQEMKTFIVRMCKLYSDYGSEACNGLVDIELETLMFIVDHKKDLTPERVCAIYLQTSKCVDPDAKKWIIPLPPKPNNFNSPTYKRDEGGSLRILHLTDVHYDPLYVPGSEADCGKPLCCQDGTPNLSQNAAGYWGDYHVCDMPRHSVENLLARIKEKHVKDVDYVYFTGDIISHKSWATNKSENTKAIKEIYTMLADAVGGKPVFPILGNHEPHPTNCFSLNNVTTDIQSGITGLISTQWIFNLVAEEWSRWLPETTLLTIKKGGYYTVVVKPGFRIIALNSNVCYPGNLWLLYNDKDPFDQLSWLVEVLTHAEKVNETVHILSHIPPGEECHVQWSNQFYRIVQRFSNIIAAQFNGHTHWDEIRLFYHPNDTNRVVNVAFNGGSFTTFVGYNPNYRIYQIDPFNTTVTNYDQYIFNLTDANQSNMTSPRWFKFYSFREAYGLQDLTYKSLDSFHKKLSIDKNAMYQYFKFLIRDSQEKINEGCDSNCLNKLLCSITAVEARTALNC